VSRELQTNRHPVEKARRAVLVGVCLGRTPLAEIEEHLEELASLADTAGAQPVARVVQRRPAPDPRFFIGGGKAEELAAIVRENAADLVIFDEDLTGSQARNLEEVVQVPVTDRSGLILEIFERRARSREARTQVELARLEYELPRLARKWSHLSRQVGGIGVRGGEGETQLEADRRLLARRIAWLKRELARIDRRRQHERHGRSEVPTIALAGYTNAGKTTLFNRLTRSDALAEDRLFATIESRVRRAALDEVRWPVLVADTVGFIRKLPHHLVASFRSTLQEVAEAACVLHVVDRSHPRWEHQRDVGVETLQSLGVRPERILEVWNKRDRLPHLLELPAGVLAISATTGLGLPELKTAIASKLRALGVSIPSPLLREDAQDLCGSPQSAAPTPQATPNG
jgi:GTP-binding protein HflX